jgi:hypothetical protein
MHLTASCQSPALPRKLVLQKAFSVGHCRHTALLQRSLRICTEAGRQCNRNCVTTTNPHGIGWSFSDWVFQCWQCNTCTELYNIGLWQTPSSRVLHAAMRLLVPPYDFARHPKTFSAVRVRRSSICALLQATTTHRGLQILLVVFAILGSGLSYVECRMHQPSLNMFSSNSGRKDH